MPESAVLDPAPAQLNPNETPLTFVADPVPTVKSGRGTNPAFVKSKFDPVRAKLAGQKSGKVRAERKQAKLAALANPVQAQSPKPVPEPFKPNPELSMVEEQITRMLEQLREPMEPTERAQLVRAFDLMLDRKRILSGDPLPGSLRPSTQAKTSRAARLLGGE